MKSIVLYQHEVRAVLSNGRALILRPVRFRKPAFVPPGCLAALELASFDGTNVVLRDGVSRMVPIKCPYGHSGDSLVAKETWSGSTETGYVYKVSEGGHRIWYRADNNRPTWADGRWRSGVVMPCWASRITLRVSSIRVLRVRSLAREDVLAVGLPSFTSNLGPRSNPQRIYQVNEYDEGGYFSPVEAFENLWNSINHKKGFGWEMNPWVWAVTAENEDE